MAFRGARRPLEADDRARRKWPQVMRMEDVQQPFGKLGIVVVEALGHARGNQRHRLDQALDMGSSQPSPAICNLPATLG